MQLLQRWWHRRVIISPFPTNVIKYRAQTRTKITTRDAIRATKLIRRHLWIWAGNKSTYPQMVLSPLTQSSLASFKQEWARSRCSTRNRSTSSRSLHQWQHRLPSRSISARVVSRTMYRAASLRFTWHCRLSRPFRRCKTLNRCLQSTPLHTYDGEVVVRVRSASQPWASPVETASLNNSLARV